MDKQELSRESFILWRQYRNGGQPNEAERALLREAYAAGALPKDADYNVYQWVEDGFPPLQ